MTNEYIQAEAYLQEIPKFAGKNDQITTKAFYKKLGSPASDIKVIHVAGTNGKGSVCAFLQSALREAGYKTGMFTSPHLVTTRERVRINGEMVSEECFVKAFQVIQRELSDMNIEKQFFLNDKIGKEMTAHKTQERGYHPSYFEYLYFMAMVIFSWDKPDVILLETGLGGRLDATNSFETPMISVITRIGMDHMEYLGNTIEEIAGEKAGIVKKGIPLVYFANDKSVEKVMENAAKCVETKAFRVSLENITDLKVHKKGIDFSYHTSYYGCSVYRLSSQALYQRDNAALAIRTLAVLGESDILKVGLEQLKEGLWRTFWEGRMEEIGENVFLDGAHNIDGIRAFLETVKARPCEGKQILLFSVVQDKDYAEMIREILEAELFDAAAVAPLISSRTADQDKVAELFKEQKNLVVESFDTVEEAFRACLNKKQKQDKVYIAGSLYLAGQVKALMETQ